jgi:hypothetical protein
VCASGTPDDPYATGAVRIREQSLGVCDTSVEGATLGEVEADLVLMARGMATPRRRRRPDG